MSPGTAMDVQMIDVLPQVDQQHVIIDYKAGKVTCSDAGLRLRVEKAVQRLTEAMNPINLDHDG